MTCLTCQHWQPKNSGLMARQYMAICALGSLWCYLPPQHTCKQHKIAQPGVVEDRKKWIAQVEARQC